MSLLALVGAVSGCGNAANETTADGSSAEAGAGHAESDGATGTSVGAGAAGDAGPTGTGSTTADASMDAALDASVRADAGSQPQDAGSGTSDAGGATGSGACPTEAEQKFSFFLTSHKALQRESGSRDGFGGNFGGLKGADGICQRIAESSSACQKNKVWRAFLSTTSVDAIDRIGEGPWYDRLGRLLANNKADLLNDRPRGANAVIANDFPNEHGVPNHDPEGTGALDNHQILTGSGTDGRLYKQAESADAGPRGSSTACNGEVWSAERATCWDWTSAEPLGCPRVGHSWPRQGSGINWISVWNEGGCAPGDNLADRGGLDGTRRVGSAGGYGGFYCFAVRP
jgi:hypothetical protein